MAWRRCVRCRSVATALDSTALGMGITRIMAQRDDQNKPHTQRRENIFRPKLFAIVKSLPSHYLSIKILTVPPAAVPESTASPGLAMR